MPVASIAFWTCCLLNLRSQVFQFCRLSYDIFYTIKHHLRYEQFYGNNNIDNTFLLFYIHFEHIDDISTHKSFVKYSNTNICVLSASPIYHWYTYHPNLIRLLPTSYLLTCTMPPNSLHHTSC